MKSLGWMALVLLVPVLAGCAGRAGRPVAAMPVAAAKPSVAAEPWEPPAVGAPPAAGALRVFAGIRMAWVPAGTFMMGSPRGESERDPEDEVHRPVTIARGFWMGTHEVTQAQWEAVMGGNPSRFTGHSRPAERVSWHECREFTRRLTALGQGVFRLPTEAEWEYACRAGTTTPFSFGSAIGTDRANYNGQYRYAGGPSGAFRGSTTPAGSFPPNAWGLHDMHGNVWEWCEDQYGVTFSPAEYPGGAPRVIRGGGWISEPLSCRSAYSYSFDPASRHDFVGFRVVREDGEGGMLDVETARPLAARNEGKPDALSTLRP